MNKFKRNYLIASTLYVILAQVAIYSATHHIEFDPYIKINGAILLLGGGPILFISGLIGIIEERFWR